MMRLVQCSTKRLLSTIIQMRNQSIFSFSSNFCNFFYNHFLYSYQQGVYPTPPGTPATPVTDQQANQNVGDNQQEAPMNVAGGAEMDDDEEFGQRDWLDWVYTFCRFMVLMGIVYFYSNFTRFFLVFAFFFIVYL